MDMKYRKILKLTTLIATSILIATASAATYRYLNIDGSITIGTSHLLWIQGTDAPSDTSISGSTVTVDLDVENGTLINFTDCLYLKNDNVTGSYSMTITIPTAVSASDFDTCNLHLYQNSSGTWAFVDTLTLTNSGDSYSGSLNAGNYLRFTFEVQAKSGATGSKAFDIQVQYS